MTNSEYRSSKAELKAPDYADSADVGNAETPKAGVARPRGQRSAPKPFGASVAAGQREVELPRRTDEWPAKVAAQRVGMNKTNAELASLELRLYHILATE
jgi:hypothetical protein